MKQLTEDQKELITDILEEGTGCSREDVVEDASLRDDLGADSLDTVELIMNIESTFSITIPDDIASEVETVGDLYKTIENYL